MSRIAFAALFLVISCVPAYSKPKDVYAVSCDDLWAAVKDTLQSPRDYTILFMSDSAERASFIVVGNLTVLTDRVSLRATDKGCALKAEITEIGSYDADWRQFHSRLARSLAKLQAGKRVEPAKTGGHS